MAGIDFSELPRDKSYIGDAHNYQSIRCFLHKIFGEEFKLVELVVWYAPCSVKAFVCPKDTNIKEKNIFKDLEILTRYINNIMNSDETRFFGDGRNGDKNKISVLEIRSMYYNGGLGIVILPKKINSPVLNSKNLVRSKV